MDIMNLMRPIFSDPQPENVIFSDELLADPQKKLNHSSFPIRLPTIAKFRLSDNCIPEWESL